MQWLFIDEHSGTGKYGRFFFLTFVAIHAEKLGKVRDALISSLYPVLASPGAIPVFPSLHASAMLPGYSDAEKIAAFTAVVDALVVHDLKIGRIGYYQKDFLGASFPPASALASISILNLALCAFEDHIVPIYELDTSRHRAIISELSDFQHQYLRISGQQLSRPVDRILGLNFVAKENHWMQFADVASYLLWIGSKWDTQKDNASDFKKALVALSYRLTPQIIYSGLVHLNNPRFKPKPGPNGFRPVTVAFPVTPSNTDTLDAQAMRWDQHIQSVAEHRESSPPKLRTP